jgi:hypothetical protein
MKLIIALCLASVLTFVLSQSFTPNMCAQSNGVEVFVNRDTDKYKLRLPNLSFVANNHNKDFTCGPSTSTNCPADRKGNQYCYVNGQIQKKNAAGHIIASLTLGAASDYYNLLQIDADIPNILHVTTWAGMRGRTDQNYFKVAMDKLSLVAGPIVLAKSGMSGCPVAPENCAVFDVQFTTVSNDYVIWGYRYDQNLTYYISALNTRCSGAPVALYQLPQHV